MIQFFLFFISRKIEKAGIGHSRKRKKESGVRSFLRGAATQIFCPRASSFVLHRLCIDFVSLLLLCSILNLLGQLGGFFMPGIGNFLRTYEFLNLTKSVTVSQMALYKAPHKTWSQVGNKLYQISWYNGLSIAAAGADVAVYLTVAALRRIGLFCPPPPAPPVFPSPHDNVQFVDSAIKRALWDWELSVRKEIEEGIESSYSDRWNVFQVVGEWSVAYSLENGERSSYFKPTFLTISEPLENGASFRSISSDFAKLWQSEKKAILHALYRQEGPPSLGYRAKKVYQDIRGLASKLHQGNQNYLKAYSEYVNIKSRAPAILQVQNQNLSSPVVPSAPALDEREIEVEMAKHVRFLRSSLGRLPFLTGQRIRSEVLNDQTDLSNGRSPKFLIAKLSLLQAFESQDLPAFLPWHQPLRSGKTFRNALQDFSNFSRSDFMKLRDAVIEPWRSQSLSATLKMRLNELNEFGQLFATNPVF